jgi:hypothetical protein
MDVAQPIRVERFPRDAAAFTLFAAGLAHLTIAPAHWGHAPAHGLFLSVAGLAEVSWGLAFWARPSFGLGRAGALMAGGLITLWAITRVVPAPFGHGPEELETFGALCKLLEATALVTLALASPGIRDVRFRATQAAVLVIAAVAFGWLAYAAALAAEPALDGLKARSEHAPAWQVQRVAHGTDSHAHADDHVH